MRSKCRYTSKKEFMQVYELCIRIQFRISWVLINFNFFIFKISEKKPLSHIQIIYYHIFDYNLF